VALRVTFEAGQAASKLQLPYPRTLPVCSEANASEGSVCPPTSTPATRPPCATSTAPTARSGSSSPTPWRRCTEYLGKGPVDCRAYLDRDLVVLVLTGGYSAGEQTLFEDGKWHDVRDARQAWQDGMEERFTQAIEQLTHRTVKAFMSASHQDPDVSVELFVLDETPIAPR
jgi:uncharacterized protein YbcI